MCLLLNGERKEGCESDSIYEDMQRFVSDLVKTLLLKSLEKTKEFDMPIGLCDKIVKCVILH